MHAAMGKIVMAAWGRVADTCLWCIARAGLFGDGHALLTELARKRVMQPGATMVPAAATVYCMGVEALTGQVSGFDMSSINTYRWGRREACILS